MARLLEVSTPGFYKHQGRSVTTRLEERQQGTWRPLLGIDAPDPSVGTSGVTATLLLDAQQLAPVPKCLQRNVEGSSQLEVTRTSFRRKASIPHRA